jgi:hypothetical protein
MQSHRWRSLWNVSHQTASAIVSKKTFQLMKKIPLTVPSYLFPFLSYRWLIYQYDVFLLCAINLHQDVLEVFVFRAELCVLMREGRRGCGGGRSRAYLTFGSRALRKEQKISWIPVLGTGFRPGHFLNMLGILYALYRLCQYLCINWTLPIMNCAGQSKHWNGNFDHRLHFIRNTTFSEG